MIYAIKAFAGTVLGFAIPSSFMDFDDVQQVPLAVAIPVALIGLALIIIFVIIVLSMLKII